MTLKLPTLIVVILGLAGGVLEYLNQATFAFQAPWNQVITFGLYAIAVFGVSPLVHDAFRNALHLSVAASTVVTTIATLVAAAVTTFSLDPSLKGVLIGAVAFLAFVGFGPTTLIPGPAPPAPA